VSALHVVKVEDHEGTGECGACPRTGLRWIVVLSDGSRIGTECAKRVLGIPVSPRNHRWVEHFDVIAEFTDGRESWVLYRRKGGVQTRDTRNGALMGIGGCEADWKRRGWL
jgi:hypothetical protein